MDMDAASMAALLELIYRLPLDPGAWTDICDKLGSLGGGTGAGLRAARLELLTFADLPRSATMVPVATAYFGEQWVARDTRLKGVPLLAKKGFYVDQDFTSEDEMATDPFYADLLHRFDLKWTLGIGFRVSNDWWAACIQRNARQGAFTAQEQSIFVQLGPHLSQACSTAVALSNTYTKGFADSLDMMGMGAVAIDGRGNVLMANHAAEKYFGGEIDVTGGRLHATKVRHAAEVETLVTRILTPPQLGAPLESVVLRRAGGKRPLVLNGCHLTGRSRSGPLIRGLAGMIVIADPSAKYTAECDVLRALYGLTNSQVALVEQLLMGRSLKDASDHLHIVPETARSYLKAIFAKTDTHRQGELIALVDKLVNMPDDRRAP